MKCAEIETDFIAWRSPAAIAEEYELSDRSSRYRHAHALGLFAKRQRNVRAAPERIIEKTGEVEVTAASVVAAVQASSKINAEGRWIDRSETVDLNELFDRMTREELEAYAPKSFESAFQEGTLQKLKNVSSRFPMLLPVGLVLGLAFCLSPITMAQAVPAETADQSPASGAIFYAAPPTGFAPLTASPSELEQYGIPPRPDAADTVPFARWKKLVSSAQTRVTKLTVKATNIIHGNLKNGKVQGIVDGTTSASSDNWSAYAVTDASGTFEANDSYVYSEWTVPAVGVEISPQRLDSFKSSSDSPIATLSTAIV